MSDIKLQLDVDYGYSLGQIQDKISKMMSRINSNPVKLKVQVDINSAMTQIAKLKNQLKDLNKDAKITMDVASLAGATPRQSSRSGKSTTGISDAATAAKAEATALNKAYNMQRQIYNDMNNLSAAKNGQSSASYQKLSDQATNVDTLVAKYKEGTINLKQFQAALAGVGATVSKSKAEITKYGEATKAVVKTEEMLTEGTKEYNAALSKIDNTQQRITTNASKWTASEKGKTKDTLEAYRNLGNELDTLRGKLQSGEITKTQFNTEFGKISSQMREYESTIKGAGEATVSFGDRLKGVITRFGTYFGMTRAIMAAISTVKKMVSASVEVESAMNRIQIVTGASNAEMGTFFDTASNQAKELGQSITDVAGSIETFSRLGYNLTDSAELSKFATIMSNVADTTVEESTTGLTSIMKGFNLDVSETEHVTDVLVNVGQKYAISASELMEAFSRGGASMNAANTSFEQSAALFAATNASLQNASKTGTLWNTVSARIRGKLVPIYSESYSLCA